jgi:hypothetical protein
MGSGRAGVPQITGSMAVVDPLAPGSSMNEAREILG